MNTPHIDTYGSGKPLVLLHGWGWNSGVWHRLLPQLQKKYQVFLVDLPGFGKSPFIQPYCFENIVPLILANLPEKSSWLGWSLGGLFALWTALHYPERIDRIITMTSSPCFIADEKWPGIDKIILEKFAALLGENPESTLHDFLELQLRGAANRVELLADIQQTFTPSHPHALLHGLHLLSTTDLRKDLVKIMHPSLHILGERDTIVPKALASEISVLMKNSRVEVMKRTGHLPFLNHPELVVELINGFL